MWRGVVNIYIKTLLANYIFLIQTQQIIATKLSDGVAISTIVNLVRNNVDEIGRTALVCRQDLHNISHQYNIEGIKLLANDHRSVSFWVDSIGDQADDSNDNPILVFKQ